METKVAPVWKCEQVDLAGNGGFEKFSKIKERMSRANGSEPPRTHASPPLLLTSYLREAQARGSIGLVKRDR